MCSLLIHINVYGIEQFDLEKTEELMYKSLKFCSFDFHLFSSLIYIFIVKFYIYLLQLMKIYLFFFFKAFT
jgi:hypothetical protein